jgi:hypothetical protein
MLSCSRVQSAFHSLSLSWWSDVLLQSAFGDGWRAPGRPLTTRRPAWALLPQTRAALPRAASGRRASGGYCPSSVALGEGRDSWRHPADVSCCGQATGLPAVASTSAAPGSGTTQHPGFFLSALCNPGVCAEPVFHQLCHIPTCPYLCFFTLCILAALWPTCAFSLFQF